MTCHDWQNWLQRFLDAETIPDQTAFDAHLATCNDCRTWYWAARRMEEGLRRLRPPVPPDDLTPRILWKVQAEQRAARRLRRRVVAVAGLAAAVLVAVLLVRYWPRPADAVPAPPNDTPIVRETPSPKGAPDMSTPAPSLRESVTEVAQLTLRKTDETIGRARTLLPSATPKGADPLPTPATPPTQPLREAGNAVTAGLEPVTDSARRAFSRLLREIPPVRTDDKRGS